jgi:hypothetical protein
VVAYLALFVALGGSSYAAIKVTGRDVKDNSLSGRDVRNNSLTGRDVKRLTSRDVANGRLLAEDFAAGQLPPDFRGAAAGGALAGSYPNPSLLPSEAWHEVNAPGEPQFVNNWTNLGPPYPTAGFYKDPLGVVHLKGFVNRSSGSGNTIFSLPPGYRTAGQEHFASAVGAAYLFTASSGGGIAVSPAASTQATLNGITFRACGEPNALPC